MIKGSGSVPLTKDPEPDPGGPKTYGSDGSGFGSAKLPVLMNICSLDRSTRELDRMIPSFRK